MPVAVAVIAAAAWFLTAGRGAPPKCTAPVIAIINTAASARCSMPAATVARRMATVSAKVTGRVLEVLIEEGMRWRR